MTSEEEILFDNVTDEALEATVAMGPVAATTLLYGSYCFTCPDAPPLSPRLGRQSGDFIARN